MKTGRGGRAVVSGVQTHKEIPEEGAGNKKKLCNHDIGTANIGQMVNPFGNPLED